MNARLIGALALAGLCVTTPMAANAAQYHVVYDGTITDGLDADGLFGLSGFSLAGMTVRADLIYDTSVPGTRAPVGTYDEVTGGEGFGTDPVISSATFTINAQSAAFSPTYYGDVYTAADGLSAYGYDLLGNSLQTFIVPTLTGPTNLTVPFSSDGASDTGGAATQYSYFAIGGDLVDFDATHVTVSAAPEPAVWAMMVVGFGAIGYALRRRRRASAVAVA